MSSFEVRTPTSRYDAVVERGISNRLASHLPANSGRVFVISTEDVWHHQGSRVERALAGVAHTVLHLPGGEDSKRLAPLETLAEQMVAAGADRSSVIVAFGGGIVGDMAGFLAAIFLRGIPVLQVPTTLLAQVDAAIGGKTGVNLVAGKNLIGAFHQPLAVLIDPATLDTLPDREYRAGLYEVLKYGIIADEDLFTLLMRQRDDILARQPDVVDHIITESVRIKTDVVSKDERESGLRRILNFGHTIGHALEAETRYSRFLHGEAVAFGMTAAIHLGELAGTVSSTDSALMRETIAAYGPIPGLAGIAAESLEARLVADKKTVHGKVHFVLPRAIGEVKIQSGLPRGQILEAIHLALSA